MATATVLRRPNVTEVAYRSELSAAGLADAISELRPGLVRRLTLVVGDRDEAEDLAQETCVRAIRSQDHFDGGDLRAWLHVIGLRLALNELRRRRRAALAWGRTPKSVPSTQVDLWESMQKLPVRERAALILSVLEGYTYAEIADKLGVPEGTVASWISRSKARLRKDLSEAWNVRI